MSIRQPITIVPNYREGLVNKNMPTLFSGPIAKERKHGMGGEDDLAMLGRIIEMFC